MLAHDVRGKLKLTLQALVPLAMFELAGTTFEQRQAAAAGASRVIGEHGDDLMFGGRRGPDALNAVVRALAVLAYQPGGVTFAGLHFCADHGECVRAEREAS